MRELYKGEGGEILPPSQIKRPYWTLPIFKKYNNFDIINGQGNYLYIEIWYTDYVQKGNGSPNLRCPKEKVGLLIWDGGSAYKLINNVDALWVGQPNPIFDIYWPKYWLQPS